MPTGFTIVEVMDSLLNTTVVFEWDPPPGSGPGAVVDNYIISITPMPISHPSINIVYSTTWNVTISYNVEYNATITALNCDGESSSPLALTDIIFGKIKYNS